MISNLPKLLTFVIILFANPVLAQEVWNEDFSIPEKGVWGDDDGITIHQDFEGISNWTLDFSKVELASSEDYAKTVTTLGGRFECRDINGEVVWRSTEINISDYKQINIQLTAYETGSGNNTQNKYLKAFYKLNGGNEILFSTNAENFGNWGTSLVEQKGLVGQTLQIVVYMVNYYTSDKVTLDEIIVIGENNDTNSPFITSVSLISENILEVNFNEPIQDVTKSNFEIKYNSETKMEILSVEKSSDQPNLVTLNISPLPYYNLQLIAKNISDFENNTTEKEIFDFEYLPPSKKYDIVINELMVDPNPKVELPELEYIEIWNREDYPINIENWGLRIDGIEKKLSKKIISPSDFVLLCATGTVEKLNPYGSTMGVPGFQGLRNSGTLVEIIDDKGNLIDRICYSDKWYGDAEKEKGGWSLERIDPNRFCGQALNWAASKNNKGGTPGSENSVFATNQDLTFPTINWAVAVSENQVEIDFSESMDSIQLKNAANFLLSGFAAPINIELISTHTIILNFENSFINNKNYTLELNGLTDECGNLIQQNSFSVLWNTIEPGDIVINEVLFNPFPGGEDYVEVYNNSQKQILTNRLFLATRNDTLQLKQIYSFSESKNLFEPQTYLALTKDTSAVFPWFNIECPGCFLQMEKFPSFKNDDDYVVLLNNEMQIIDELLYSTKMHSPILADEEGIALERISFIKNTNLPENWHSASSQSGYGTPGYKNSQLENENLLEPTVSFEPQSFSPNLDGYNDEFLIHYQLEKPGYIANAWVFDAAGRYVLQLAKNEILGTNGDIKWNGEDETGQRQKIGVYVVMVELFDMQGNIRRYKDGVVLTDVLN